jgi:transitional endoplasmic reticulum ATPase
MSALNKFGEVADTDGPFADFKVHSNAHRVDTSLFFLESLRKHYPNFWITCVDQFPFDLLGYAKAGHAKAILKEDGQPFQQKKYYVAPSGSTSSDLGKLGDNTKFGKYAYTCDNSTFIVYKLEYELERCGTQHEYFVLTPKTDGNLEEGHSRDVESILLKIGKWSSELHDEVYVFDSGRWTKNKHLWKSRKDATWDNVILDKATKKSIIDDVENFFDRKEFYEELGVPWKRGIIFHGVPGNGKTISIRALMGSLAARPVSIPSLYVKSLDSQLGEQYSVRSIFSLARTMAPCLLIFEDLDSLVTDKVRSYFLNEVDGLESNDGILIIGSTNHLEKLDPAISKRPSRFDRKYHFRLPNEVERLAYCDYWRQKLQKTSMIKFSADVSPIVAKLTEGFSFAYLKELFIMTLLIIAHGGDLDDDNDSTEEETKADTPHTEDSLKASESNGNKTDAVVVESPTVDPQRPEEKKKDHSELLEKLKAQDEVVIPKYLQNNILLKVLRKQSRVLLLEMDNTDVEKWKSGRLGYNTFEGSGRPIRMPIRNAIPSFMKVVGLN